MSWRFSSSRSWIEESGLIQAQIGTNLLESHGVTLLARVTGALMLRVQVYRAVFAQALSERLEALFFI